jgi:hypothetical protein
MLTLRANESHYLQEIPKCVLIMRSSPNHVLWLKKSEAEAIRSRRLAPNFTNLIRSPRNSTDHDADSWSLRRHVTLRRGWLDHFSTENTTRCKTSPIRDAL